MSYTKQAQGRFLIVSTQEKAFYQIACCEAFLRHPIQGHVSLVLVDDTLSFLEALKVSEDEEGAAKEFMKIIQDAHANGFHAVIVHYSESEADENYSGFDDFPEEIYE